MKELKISRYLDTQILRKKYLQECFKDFNAEMFISAVKEVVEAEGIENIAARIGTDTTFLEETFREDAHPSYDIIHKILKVLDINLEEHYEIPKNLNKAPSMLIS